MTKKELEMRVNQLEEIIKQLPSEEDCKNASLESMKEENYAYMYGWAIGGILIAKNHLEALKSIKN